VIDLAVHTEGSASVVFREGDEDRAARRDDKDSTLTAYFKLNAAHTGDSPHAATLRDMYYTDVVDKFIFDGKTREWRPRAPTCPKEAIGSLNAVSPKNREAFFLRLLLQHVKCPKSYEDIRTVDGVLYDSNEDACGAMGLLRDDNELLAYFFLHCKVN